jgi:hypothetical protein
VILDLMKKMIYRLLYTGIIILMMVFLNHDRQRILSGKISYESWLTEGVYVIRAGLDKQIFTTSFINNNKV